jgi:hypothetical protein
MHNRDRGWWSHTVLVSRLARTNQPAIAPPNIWKATYRTHLGRVVNRAKNVAMLIVGLRWPPETVPAAYINNGSVKITITAPIKVGITGPDGRPLFTGS